jgi:hypothetical protein
MYHEEKVINGVLCWRGTPDGEWKQYTAEALTIALTAERSRAKDLEALALKASSRIENVRAAIAG